MAFPNQFSRRSDHLWTGVWLTEQVPGAFTEEVSLGEDLFIFKDILEISRVLDHDARWESEHGDFVCFECEAFLALHKPVKKYMSWLQELDSISEDWKRV